MQATSSSSIYLDGLHAKQGTSTERTNSGYNPQLPVPSGSSAVAAEQYV